MLEIVGCVVDKHNLWLVLLAALICALSVVTTLQVYNRGRSTVSSARPAWMAAAGAVGGAGIWATHFVAMLAYSPSLPIQYDMTITVLSLIIGMVGAGLGFATAGNARPALGGAMVGLSIVAMHYCGLAAIRTAFAIQWNPVFVAASILISVGFAGAALRVQDRASGPAGRAGAAGLLLLAIVGLHFTGMTAVTLIPDASVVAASPEVVSRPVLAAIVGAVVLAILAVGSALIVIQTQSRRTSLGALQLAFQGVPSAVALYDAQSRLRLWNEAFEALMHSFGVTPVQGVERDVLMRSTLPVLKGGGDEAIGFEDAIEDSGAPWEGALPDGRWLRIERRLLADGSLIAVLTDITDQRRWGDAMQDARDKAEAASRAKSEFLANMSHEIRTPLNGVLGMIQAMERDTLEPRQRERLSVAHDSGRALLSVLNDILDHAKVEAGQVELETEPFDAALLATSVCGAYSGAAAIKDLGLDWRVEPEAQGWWIGDALKLRQILSNLIANALKFTSVGGVTLVIGAEDGRLCLTVRDTGIGVDPADAERLFEKFAQADGSTSRKFGGTGLGLSICRGLTERMGGDIRVESALGQGSCFIVSLPLSRTEAPAPVSHTAPAPTVIGDERKLVVLLAEDNPVNQLVLRSLLEPLDVDLTVVDGGREAIEAFRHGRFDIVLMDIQMPEVSGVEATRAIRKVEASCGEVRTPIVALTANVMPEQLREYAAAGMDAHVPKPIEVERLYAVMAGLLEPADDAASPVEAAIPLHEPGQAFG